jgi:hypothetical protein
MEVYHKEDQEMMSTVLVVAVDEIMCLVEER